MSTFLTASPALEDYWRAIILFGRNAASYKFALAKALLELQGRPGDLVRLEDLAIPFSRHIVEHLRHTDKQGTSSGSAFLDACRQHMRGVLSSDELLEETVRRGFNNVLDAFHVIGTDELITRFFINERKAREGIRLTDEMYRLAELGHITTLETEVEARWRLVETAWSLNLSRNLVAISYDEATKDLYAIAGGRRVDVTSSRGALSGYQKGYCFYCYGGLVEGEIEVDHFLPHVLQREGMLSGLDGVWNLVLSCDDCNAGIGGKHDRIVERSLLERLHTRNEFLISSHHPLRETLLRQTGTNESERRSFLQSAYNQAVLARAATTFWHATPKREDPFTRGAP
jgi:hypothetical protein